MGLFGVTIYFLGWITGGFTCVVIYKSLNEAKLESDRLERERQRKIRELNSKYGDIE